HEGQHAALASSSRPKTIPKEEFFDNLFQKLKNRFVSEDNERFLPWNDLRLVLDNNTVRECILQLDVEEEQYIQIYGDRCSSSRLRILATLILTDCIDYYHLNSFLEEGIFDNSLPLKEENAPVFTRWTDREKNAFCKEQYIVLAPCFNFSRDKLRHYIFDPSIPMPFFNLRSVGRGGDGMVSSVTIQSGHHWVSEQGLGTEGKIFALKEFTKYTTFAKEREALDHFSGANPGHDHLSRLLLSFDRASKWYMIFDWANEDLENFWKTFSSHPKSHIHLSWLIAQCHGMAEGLSKVHGDGEKQQISTTTPPIPDRGRHGDIKPSNILCFNQNRHGEMKPSNIPQDDSRLIDYQLVVADFTLMHFHSPYSLGGTSPRNLACSRSYRPPEKDIESAIKIDQSYDVWTLGCVYLEFISWYLLGYEAVREDYFCYLGKYVKSFPKMRMDEKSDLPQDDFFIMTKNRFLSFPAVVKPGVVKWFQFLRQNKDCSQAIHDILDLIEKHMLVPNPKGRWKMFEISERLETIHKKCERDEAYCSKGVPRRVNFISRFGKDFPPQGRVAVVPETFIHRSIGHKRDRKDIF
ncbi:unnamed protein product, partial [Clonostachys byssicola]